MDKTLANYIIDIVLAITFFITAISGVILFFAPHGPGSSWLSIFWLYKATWIWLHNYVGLLMVFVALIHFVFHWNWYVCMTKNYLKKLKKSCKK